MWWLTWSGCAEDPVLEPGFESGLVEGYVCTAWDGQPTSWTAFDTERTVRASV